MSTTAIAIRQDQVTFDDLQTKALAHLGVQTANKADVAVFFHVCKSTGLDPFARQIFMIERQGKQTIQVGIDGFRLIAQRTTERTHGTLGYGETEWCDADGNWADVWLSKEPPSAARVTVKRNGQDFPAVALWSEYAATKRDGNLTAMWRDRPAGQLAKCAEALALRKAFPQDLSGIYTGDEMAHTDQQPHTERPSVQAADFAPVDVTDGEVIEDDPQEFAGGDPS